MAEDLAVASRLNLGGGSSASPGRIVTLDDVDWQAGDTSRDDLLRDAARDGLESMRTVGVVALATATPAARPRERVDRGIKLLIKPTTADMRDDCEAASRIASGSALNTRVSL